MALLRCWSPGQKAMDLFFALDEYAGSMGMTSGVHHYFHQVHFQDHGSEYELEDELVLESTDFVLRELLDELLGPLLASADLI